MDRVVFSDFFSSIFPSRQPMLALRLCSEDPSRGLRLRIINRPPPPNSPETPSPLTLPNAPHNGNTISRRDVVPPFRPRFSRQVSFCAPAPFLRARVPRPSRSPLSTLMAHTILPGTPPFAQQMALERSALFFLFLCCSSPVRYAPPSLLVCTPGKPLQETDSKAPLLFNHISGRHQFNSPFLLPGQGLSISREMGVLVTGSNPLPIYFPRQSSMSSTEV